MGVVLLMMMVVIVVLMVMSVIDCGDGGLINVLRIMVVNGCGEDDN